MRRGRGAKRHSNREPSDSEALEQLSKTYEKSGDTGELIELLSRRVDAADTPEERRELRLQLAAVHREAAKDRASEIAVLRDLLAEQPSDDGALAALSARGSLA